MSRILWDQRNYEKIDILIEIAKMLLINILNVLCFSTWVLSTMTQEETAWVFRNNDQQSYKMSSEKNSWQMTSMKKNAISY